MSKNVLTDIEISNDALDLLGVENVISLEDDSKQGRLCKKQFPICRNFILSIHPWNFAIKRQVLAELSVAPVFGYDRFFQLPADYLTVLPPSQHEKISTQIVYKIEDGKLATDELTFNLKYISEVLDTSKFTPSFSQTLSAYMASKMAYKLINDRGVARDVDALYRNHISQARSINAMESTPEIIDADTWFDARRLR